MAARRRLSSCGERGLLLVAVRGLLVAVRGLLVAVVSLETQHRLWVRGLQ